MWFDDRPGQGIKVGREALESQIRFPDSIISSVKRQIGKSEKELKDPGLGDPRLPVHFQGREFGATQISAEILRYVAEGA